MCTQEFVVTCVNKSAWRLFAFVEKEGRQRMCICVYMCIPG